MSDLKELIFIVCGGSLLVVIGVLSIITPIALVIWAFGKAIGTW